MKRQPLVLICIPSFNRLDTLLSAIKSVFSQTYKNWILYISDHSTAVDVFNFIPSEYLNDSRVLTIRREVNFSSGTEHIKKILHEIKIIDFDYFTILADDDFFLPNALDVVSKNSHCCDLIISSFLNWYTKSHIVEYKDGLYGGYISGRDEMYKLLTHTGINIGDNIFEDTVLNNSHMSCFYVAKSLFLYVSDKYGEVMTEPFGDVGYSKFLFHSKKTKYIAMPIAVISIGDNYGMVGSMPGNRLKLLDHHSSNIKYSPFKGVSFSSFAYESYCDVLTSLGVTFSKKISMQFLKRHIKEIILDNPISIRTCMDFLDIIIAIFVHGIDIKFSFKYLKFFFHKKRLSNQVSLKRLNDVDSYESIVNLFLLGVEENGK